MSDTNGLLESIIQKTNNDLIFFFILFIIALIAFFIPFYRLTIKDRKERYSQEKQREERLIKVVEQNTEAITKLNTRLEIDSNSTKASFDRLHSRMDAISHDIKNIFLYLRDCSQITGIDNK